jgi:hypothetical protein
MFANHPRDINFPTRTTSPVRPCTYNTSGGIVGADMDAKELRRRQKSNQAVARCIPVILICAVIYASWVFVGPLCGGSSPDGQHGIPTNHAQWNTSSIHRRMLGFLSA